MAKPYAHSAQWEVLERHAVAQLPTVPPPKPPKGGGKALGGYITSRTSTSQLSKPNLQIANVDLVSAYRTAADTNTVVRGLVRVNPEAAGSQAAHLRLGIPEKYIAIARDADGEFNVEATRLALQILRKMEYMPDYENGFSHVGSLRSVSESLGRQIFQTGGMGMELVLDKARLPFGFMPVATNQIFWLPDGISGLKPIQRIAGEDIDLDTPTFFYVALDPDVLDAYAQSPLESAIQPILGATQFLNDLRRLCARHIYKRYDIVMDWKLLEERIPVEFQGDNDSTQAWLNDQIQQVEDTINSLGVEEALVHFDFFEVKYVEGDAGDTPETLETVRDIYGGKISTATKTPKSILGLGATSAGAADADTLLFMVHVNGMIRVKLQELYSKALTLAVRLMGEDVTVEFLYDEIELKPKSELAAFRAMNQSYWRQQLSDGYITDEEYCLRTTGNLPRKGFKPRTGLYFMDSAAPADGSEAGSGSETSNTSNIGRNRNKAPSQPKGPAK